MKFSIPADKLKAFASDAVKITTTRGPVDCCAWIKIDASKEGRRVTFTGWNGSQRVVIGTIVDVDVSGSVCVGADRFGSIIQVMKDTVCISVKSDRMTVMSGSAKMTLGTHDVKAFPAIEQMEDNEKLKLSLSGMKKLIAHHAYARNSRDARLSLRHVTLFINKDELSLITSDGHRLSRGYLPVKWSGPVKNASYKIVVPMEFIQFLSQVNPMGEDDDATLVLEKKAIWFSYKNRLLRSALIDESALNFDSVIPTEITHQSKLVANLQQLRSILAGLKSLATYDVRPVINLSSKSGEVSLTYKSNTTHDTAFDTFQPVSIDSDFSITINVHYLTECLNHIEGENVHIHYNPATSAQALLVRNEVTAGVSVLMPMLG